MSITGRKHKDKSTRKAEILAAAEKIFFKNGIGNASMDAVAQEADVSKGTLYLYFKNKNALYRAILRRAFETLNNILGQPTSEGPLNGKELVYTAGKAYIKFSMEYPGYFDAILHYENETLQSDETESESIKSMIAGNQVLEKLANFVKTGKEDGSIKSDQHPLKIALILWGSITGILQMLNSKNQLIKHYYSIEQEELIESFFETVLNPL